MRGRLARGDVGFGDRAALVFLSCACLASAAGGEETSAPSVPKSAPTLLVSFTGYRADIVPRRAGPPGVARAHRALARAAARVAPAAVHLEDVSQPLQPGHGSERADPRSANRFRPPTPTRVSRPKALLRALRFGGRGEPRRVTARRDGRDARVYFWPGSESEIRGVRPSEWRAYGKDGIVRRARRRRRGVDARGDGRAVENKTKTKHPFLRGVLRGAGRLGPQTRPLRGGDESCSALSR